MDLSKEKWSNSVNTLGIGAAEDEGGSRKSKVLAGGQSTLPFLFNEGEVVNKPIIAMEVLDSEPLEWPDTLKEPFSGVLTDPLKWADKCVKEFNADIICLKLQSIHPDFGNAPVDKAAELVGNLLKAVDVPLIILGCGNDEKDNLVLPKCSEIARGESCLIGQANQNNYKTLTAACLADGHSIIAESPIDINIAKQLNLLITDMGFPADKIAINPTIGALGYGMEYGYSIMERARIAALGGDKMLSMPFICLVGSEAWRAKEAKSLSSEHPEWGDEENRGISWETVTAACILQAGADILVMRHPKAVDNIKKTIEQLMVDKK